MAREFTLKGKTLQDLRGMSPEEFSALLPSRYRRKIKRGFTPQEKKFLAKVRKSPQKFHKTHSREMIIIPELLGVKLGIHNGKEFVTLDVGPEHLGRRLGEFAQTRRMVKHSAPGFGATRSSKYVPLK